VEILRPAAAMAGLTALVWVWMYVTRFREMWQKKIGAQELAIREVARAKLAAVAGPADDFLNLFELPVLFYAATIILYATHLADATDLWLAWAFVALRSVHSLIHCTYNRVTHRFTAYLWSTLALWALWLRLGFRLFA
jgi:hypothetical protein